MAERVYNVLFLCTGNSARSVMAESILNHLGKGRFRAFSAGSFPTGKINPFTVDLLDSKKLPVDGLRSKSWDEFARAGAPEMDFIFTVCDQAAGETCPVWPGHPATAHWGIEDPAHFVGTDAEKRRFFDRIFLEISARIRLFLALPLDKIDRLALQKELARIGKTKPGA
jgi:arsenate reductase (thioredoxin)